MERNKILRQILPDGPKLIDHDGNYLVKIFKVPLTSFYIYLPFYGRSLQDRKRMCEQELAKLVLKLTESQENKNKEHGSSNSKSNEDKEWSIFKRMRIFLEEQKK